MFGPWGAISTAAIEAAWNTLTRRQKFTVKCAVLSMSGYLLALAGCSVRHERQSRTFTCQDHGTVTYKAEVEGATFYDGAWHLNGLGGEQYRPSMYESCHTEIQR